MMGCLLPLWTQGEDEGVGRYDGRILCVIQYNYSAYLKHLQDSSLLIIFIRDLCSSRKKLQKSTMFDS